MNEYFTKDDLKPGMVVKISNNETFLVIDTVSGLYLTNATGYVQLEQYTLDLINTNDSEYNIESVYIPNTCDIKLLFKEAFLTKIWQRKTTVTLEEIAEKFGIDPSMLCIEMSNGTKISKK